MSESEFFNESARKRYRVHIAWDPVCTVPDPNGHDIKIMTQDEYDF